MVLFGTLEAIAFHSTRNWRSKDPDPIQFHACSCDSGTEKYSASLLSSSPSSSSSTLSVPCVYVYPNLAVDCHPIMYQREISCWLQLSVRNLVFEDCFQTFVCGYYAVLDAGSVLYLPIDCSQGLWSKNEFRKTRSRADSLYDYLCSALCFLLCVYLPIPVDCG